MSLNNKVAIVTGAASGIGAAIAEKLNDEGAQIILADRNETQLQADAARFNSPLVIKADFSKEEDIVRIIDETIKKFGKIDILVNNVGISSIGSILIGDILKAYDEVMKVNFKAVVHLTKLAAPHLIQTKGSIVNVSSVAADRTTTTLIMYSCSKAALNHFSKDVALELAPHKVRVNVISPGPVRTNSLKQDEECEVKKMTALDRISMPEEIADLALFLVCDKAKGITGSVFASDNGLLIKG